MTTKTKTKPKTTPKKVDKVKLLEEDIYCLETIVDELNRDVRRIKIRLGL